MLSNRKIKQFTTISIRRQLSGPLLIVRDAELAGTTPARTWLGMGLRSIDHCVEAYAGGALSSSPAVQAVAAEGIRLLAPALLRTARGEADGRADRRAARHHDGRRGSLHAPPAGRRRSQHQPPARRHRHGARRLQRRHDASRGGPQQRRRDGARAAGEASARRLLVGADGGGRAAGEGLRSPDASLSDVLDALIRTLGLPRTLAEVGIGKEKYTEIAENSVKDSCTKQRI